jgi:hypothetical protein
MQIVTGCISSKTKDKCSCYSQQATIIDMPKEVCLQYLEHKAFNPFKQENKEPQQKSARGEHPAIQARNESIPDFDLTM